MKPAFGGESIMPIFTPYYRFRITVNNVIDDKNVYFIRFFPKNKNIIQLKIIDDAIGVLKSTLLPDDFDAYLVNAKKPHVLLDQYPIPDEMRIFYFNTNQKNGILPEFIMNEAPSQMIKPMP